MTDPAVLNTDAEGFAGAVLEASARMPVLVDFWASWCGPCKALAPVLEQLAGELAGSVRIVKVDSDAEPELAASYGVRSLPTLLLFRNGEVVEQLVGAQPASAIRAALGPWLPRPGDSVLEQAGDLLAAGDTAAAATVLDAALSEDPEDARLRLLLADALLQAGRLDDAEAQLRNLPANIAADDDAQRLLARLRLLQAADLDDAGGADEHTGAWTAAMQCAARGDFESALAGLLALVQADRNWRDGAARRAMLDIFEQLPAGDPLLREYRTRLARSLN